MTYRRYDPLNDYYLILGVATSATQDQIQAAFRQRAKELHPDRNPEPGATERFQKISEAYAVLSNPEKRAEYDRTRAAAASEFIRASYRPKQGSSVYRRHSSRRPRTLWGSLWYGPFRYVWTILLLVAALNVILFILNQSGTANSDSPTVSPEATETAIATPVTLTGLEQQLQCPPGARISSPADHANWGSTLAITGAAQGAYEVDWAVVNHDATDQPEPFTWQLLFRSDSSPPNDTLVSDDILRPLLVGLPRPAEILLRLVVIPAAQAPAELCQVDVNLLRSS